jgi:hypothetical protein
VGLQGKPQSAYFGGVVIWEGVLHPRSDNVMKISIAKFIGRFLVLVGTGLAVCTAEAQNFAITQSTIAAGGGTSTNTQYTVSGTVGQPTVGPAAGGAFEVESGFWSAAFVIQSEGAPVLSLVRSGSNLILSWPATAGGFQLQDSTNLRASWNFASVTPLTNNGVISVTVPVAPGIRFFRLAR